jgi:hypothetical protein
MVGFATSYHFRFPLPQVTICGILCPLVPAFSPLSESTLFPIHGMERIAIRAGQGPSLFYIAYRQIPNNEHTCYTMLHYVTELLVHTMVCFSSETIISFRLL